MNFLLRRRAWLGLAFVVLGTAVFVAFSQSKEKPPIDPDIYKEFMGAEVTDIYDLEAYFSDQQSFFLPITPPAADLILNQPGLPTVIPFDWENFPDAFRKHLSFEYENSVPVYPVTIIEDVSTREIHFLNADQEIIYSLSPAMGYNPFAALRNTFPGLYAGRYTSEQIAHWQSLYDPARIRISARLIPTEYVEPYLYVSALLFDQAMASLSKEKEGDGMGLRLLEDAASNIVFLAISRVSTGNHLVIGYPDTFTNRLDVFTCTDLIDERWSFAAEGLSTAGTNRLTWVDTNYWAFIGLPYRNYAAGNADSDGDGDGYADAAEMMVYKSDPADSNSHPVRVSGSVAYAGIETGTIYVISAWSAGSWSLATAVTRSGPGAWTNEVSNDRSYWFRAFRDVNANYTRESWEPWGEYASGSTLITGETTGINMTLHDQASVWGTLSYTGSVSGDIHVIAVSDADSWSTTYGDEIPWTHEGASGEVYYTEFPIDYRITDLPASNYWIRAFVDANSNDTRDVSELIGQYGLESIAVSNRRTGINFSLQSPPSISGTVSYTTYSGGQTGLIYVVAVASSNSCATNYSAVLSAPGSYQIEGIPPGNYWIWAWRDSDGNLTNGVYEALGNYTNSAVLVTGQLVNANIVLTDPDTDGDGMGDWWELRYWQFLPDGISSHDDDGDKLMNLYEYYAGTDPTVGFVDTDGDGMSDDWEFWYGLDPSNPSDANTDLDQDGWTNVEEYTAGTDPTNPASYPAGSWYVSTNGVDAVSRGGYTNPLASISYAMNGAASGNRIIILPGTYSGPTNVNLNFGNKNLTVTGLKGLKDQTIIDAQQSDRIFSVTNGFTISSIRDLTMRNGASFDPGGAIYCSVNAYLQIADCNFESNISLLSGGALAGVSNALFNIDRCTFRGNWSGYDGGAIWAGSNTFTDFRIANSLFVSNRVNSSTSTGGALYFERSNKSILTLINNTFIANEAGPSGVGGGAMRLIGVGTPIATIENCILWGNKPNQWSGTADFRFSCVEGSSIPPGPGNFNLNPLLAADGWHLSAASPCRNAGTNLLVSAQQRDLDGDERIEDWTVDVGADEYSDSSTRYMHMPSYDQSNTWGITVVGVTTKVWAAALNVKAKQPPLQYWFTFGDGEQSPTVTVSSAASARYMVAPHVFTTASVYTVSAFIRDNLNVTATQTFQLACRETNDFDARISHTIEEGLIWLYTNAVHIGGSCYWRYEYNPQYIAHPNGMALSAFAAFGHRIEYTNVVYSTFLDRGLQYLLHYSLSPISITNSSCYYNPDANTNGLGVTIGGSNRSLYEIGSVMAGMVGVGDPNSFVPTSAPSNMQDRTYRDIVQDMSDYCGWAQTCTGYGRGGWRYEPNVDADSSASFWPTFGLYHAEDWGISISNALRAELSLWVAYSQGPSGSFGYIDPWEPSTARTACGLAQLAFLGHSITNEAVQKARAYLGSASLPGVTDHYGMHAFAKAANMIDTPLEMISDRSWRYVCATNLFTAQAVDGSWMGQWTGNSIGRVFGTAASISILSEATPWRIFVTDWTRSPGLVHSTNTVSISAVTLPRVEATNMTLTTWYRTAETNSFISLGMTNYIDTYTTTSSIPAQAVSTKVEYYLEVDYWREGIITTQRYPSAHSGDFQSYIVGN